MLGPGPTTGPSGSDGPRRHFGRGGLLQYVRQWGLVRRGEAAAAHLHPANRFILGPNVSGRPCLGPHNDSTRLLRMAVTSLSYIE